MYAEKLIIWGHEPHLQTAELMRLAGGKAAGLHQLQVFGLNVPRWGVLTTVLFSRVYVRDKEIGRLASGSLSDDEKARSLRSRVANIELTEEERGLLSELWMDLSEKGLRPVAVRSSAADEDSETLSFAGQMDSFLNIRSEEAFHDAVRSCWASLFNDRAVYYRRKNNIDPWSPQIAVIAQQMVAADVSGVAFTANPLTGNRHEMLVNSTWGLGEGLVAGTLEADTFILDTGGKVVKSTIAVKQKAVNQGSPGGTETRPVRTERQSMPSMTAFQLKELHGLAIKVQGLMNRPMDIEFALEGDVLYLLQARPITTLPDYTEQDTGSFTIWDNSNIVESYSGVTTPLTFSFIKGAYYAVYVQFCEVIGVDKKTIFRNRHVFENMLGLIQGRVYYNLINWYRLVSLMPGFSYNKKFMEQMMGLQVIKEVSFEESPQSTWKKYMIELPKLLKVGAKTLAAHITLQRRVSEFHANFRKIYSEYAKIDFDKLTPSQIIGIYRTLEEKVLWKWKAPIINDFEAMIFYGLLKRLTVKWKLDEDGSLQNDLLCGEGGIRSTNVTTDLALIAKEIEAREELRSGILACSPEEALVKLRNDRSYTVIRRTFERYLEEYGVRSMDEMKLESIPIKDNPVFCVSVIQNYLRTGVPDIDLQKRREQSIRRSAEGLLKTRIKAGYPLIYPFKLALYRWVLKNARNAIKNRENQRFARAEAYSLMRSMMRAIGRNWHARGVLGDPEDIFYLELGEIRSFIEGTSTFPGLKKLSEMRKQEFKTYQEMSPEDHIETRGEVYLNSDIFAKKGPVGTDETVLEGLGCCQGIVERMVKVVIKPDSSLRLNGDIMVAKQTDPGWVVLFPSVSGLIIEKGSMLSHSAIVAREMGIPTVVGVKDVTQKLRSGDTVRLDGANGRITILQRGMD